MYRAMRRRFPGYLFYFASTGFLLYLFSYWGDTEDYSAGLSLHSVGDPHDALQSLIQEVHQLAAEVRLQNRGMGRLFSESFSDSPDFSNEMPQVPLPTKEVQQGCCQDFIGNNLERPIEWDEWVLAEAFVRPGMKVLEFGARYGTTSCQLSRLTGNNGSVVSVEIDSTVWQDLERNRKEHKCGFHIVKGSVGDLPLKSLGEAGFATQSDVAAESEEALPNFDYKDIEDHVGYRFNTLLIDCEGCVLNLLQGKTLNILKQVTTILIEEDQAARVGGAFGYKPVYELFRSYGFERVWRTQDTYDRAAAWSREMEHSVWRKGGMGPYQTCENFRKKHEFDDSMLECLTVG